MNSTNVWTTMWQQADIWHIFLVLICGIIVGMIYFQSLRWSINRLHTFKHKWSVFGGIALFRIALFFAVLVLTTQKNMVLIVFYLAAFFCTKMLIVWLEKRELIKDKSRSENADG